MQNCFFMKEGQAQMTILSTFSRKIKDCVYYPSEIFTGVIKCLRTAYYLLREMFSFNCALVDFMHKQEFPFLCNNQKPSLILNQILKESYRSGLKVETWGISLG